MSFSLESILGYTNLTGIIQGTVSGIPDVLPPAFRTTKTTTIGDSGRYTRVTGNRQTARLAMYGSPARRRELRDIGIVDVKLMHTFEEIMMDPLTLQNLHAHNSYQYNQGKDEVARQVMEFGRYFTNLEIASTVSAIFVGAIYFDTQGNLLPSSVGAQVSIDYGVSAGNKGQLDVFGGGAIIAASWATPSTDIPGHLRGIRQAARRKTGYPLRYAFYGKNIPGYLTANTLVQAYLSRNPVTHQKFLDTGELPDGLFGFTWVPAYEAFWEDASNSFQSFVGDDQVSFTPEVDATWYELMEGTYQVPSTFNATANMGAALGTLSTVTGMFSYAVPTHNPPTALMYTGNTWLPIIKVPDAVYLADVTP